MQFVAEHTTLVRNGLLGSQAFLNAIIVQNQERIERDPVLHIKLREIANPEITKIKAALQIVEEGLKFFEDTWIIKEGNRTGEVIKFNFINPRHWKLFSQSTVYYANLFKRLIDSYKAVGIVS